MWRGMRGGGLMLSAKVACTVVAGGGFEGGKGYKDGRGTRAGNTSMAFCG